jgi:hypothetical protein
MVTHSSTSRPVQCLCMAERTGCPVLTDLWSYVLVAVVVYPMMLPVTHSRKPRFESNTKAHSQASSFTSVGLRANERKGVYLLVLQDAAYDNTISVVSHTIRVAVYSVVQ